MSYLQFIMGDQDPKTNPYFASDCYTYLEINRPIRMKSCFH